MIPVITSFPRGFSVVLTIVLVASILLLGIAAYVLFFGFLMPNPQQIQTGDLVRCSNYNKIVDRYMIPGPEYHIVVLSRFGGSIDLTIRGEGYNYSNYLVGKYTRFPDKLVYTLEEMNETETGYRDACKVIGYA